ncbi:MAG: Gfo/Idh/MocA family oxidoreductase, partial [Bacteroidetes bacterium]|nr:Gfo/Idh/MocA family oxidoreductase [Bacteroidota bacterium]
ERSKNLAAEKYPGIKTFRTLEELLADAAAELVVVNTPNYTHYDYTKKALLAGKHVVVEKPFTVTVAEAEELIALAKKADRKISVYQNRRFDSDYKTVKKIIDEQWLGRIVEAEIHYDRFNLVLSYKVHKETPGPGTGLLYDLGSHLIDQALQLFGMPEAVFADLAVIRPDSKVDDYMELLLYYPGLRVRIKSSYVVREALPSYSIHGTKGSFIKARTDIQERMLQAGETPDRADWGIEPDNEKGLLHAEKDGKVIREYVPSLRGNYMEYYDGIYKALRENAAMPVAAEDGLAIIKVIEAAYKSRKTGALIKL